MRSSTASCTPRTASPSTARPCANHRKNLPSVPSLTQTPPREPLKPSTGATVRDHRNVVRDRSESLSAINRNTCPQSPESALQDSPADRSRSGAHMVALATYMGHVNIYATYWYLEATADLMRDVAAAGEGFVAEGRQS